MDGKLSWLRGPLPPLSESILSSGLVREPIFFAKPDPKPTHNSPQPIFPVTHLKPRKLPHPKYKHFNEYNILNLRPPPIVPQRVSMTAYKPPPLTEETLHQPPRPNPLHDSVYAERQVFLSDTQKRGIRAEIASLVQELDSNIASLVSLSTADLSNANHQAKLKADILKFYNYAFNHLILLERSTSSDKALLLRRFHEYYNQLVSEIPELHAQFSSEKSALESQLEDVAGQVRNLTADCDQFRSLFQASDTKNGVLESEIARLNSEINQKDVTISSLTYDLDYARGQCQRLSFKLTGKKQKQEGIKRAIAECDSEVRQQLAQIEGLENQLRSYQNGETGYILKYHQEIENNEKLKADMEAVRAELNEIKNREKANVGVDTSDIPQRKSKKNKKTGSVHKGPIQSLASQPANTITNQSSKLPQLVDVNVQTDPLPEPEVQIVEKTDVKEIEDTETTSLVTNLTMRKATLIENAPYVTDVSPEKLMQIPDLRAIVTPFMSSVYTAPVAADVRVLNRSAIEKLGEHRKPLIWALQTIHNFLCDPFIRGIIGTTKTMEMIVLDWISNQFKVQHLTSMAMANLANAMVEWGGRHPMIDLFAQMIEGSFAFPQVCFIATVYAFSCGFVEPNLIDLLQRMDVDPLEYTVKIHIKFAHALLTKCLSADISAELLASRVDPKNPMLGYFEFLHEAGQFFGTKHMMIYNQIKQLLGLCGATDSSIIGYEVFQDIMVFLGNEKNLKEDWKIMLRSSEVKGSVVKFPDFLHACAERREILLELVSLPSLHEASKTLSRLSPQVKELHRELVARFAKIVIQTFEMWPSSGSGRFGQIRYDLRRSLLSVDVGQAIWFYRLLINKLDKLIMMKKGFIPFNTSASPETISQITEYIERSESVALALLET